MWLLGFSAPRRSLRIIGAILLVILLFMALRKLLIYLEETKDQREGKIAPEQPPCRNGVTRTYALEELKMASRDFRIRIGVGATSFVYMTGLGDQKFGAVKRNFSSKSRRFTWLLFGKMRATSSAGIPRALDYLHSQADPPTIHSDVKSSNILLVDNHHAKLADFGLCKLGFNTPGSQSPTKIKGSLGYIDVNYLKTGLISPKSDVYSFGVLLLELITGLKSTQGSMSLAEWTGDYMTNDDVKVWAKLLDPKLNGDVNLGQIKVLMDLAHAALLENSKGRPDMRQIVERILSCLDPQSHSYLPV
ncbi:hypothetical protein SLE2022_223400 [Rubroshorea leprosula]